LLLINPRSLAIVIIVALLYCIPTSAHGSEILAFYGGCFIPLVLSSIVMYHQLARMKWAMAIIVSISYVLAVLSSWFLSSWVFYIPGSFYSTYYDHLLWSTTIAQVVTFGIFIATGDYLLKLMIKRKAKKGVNNEVDAT
jgi:hypothetical protein